MRILSILLSIAFLTGLRSNGEEAWEKYIAEFCKQHKKEIKKEGGGTVWTSALQNGYRVVSYGRQLVKLTY